MSLGEHRFVVGFTLTRTDGPNLPAEFVQTALEEVLDVVTDLFATDDDEREAEYSIDYAVLIEPA